MQLRLDKTCQNPITRSWLAFHKLNLDYFTLLSLFEEFLQFGP